MLRLSTKGRYATRILTRLAVQGGPATRKEIAEAEGLSADYLEQIMTPLRAAGLVKSLRGARGGFDLVGDPRSTTVLEVLEAVEGSLDIVACLSESCEREDHCVTQPIWRRATEALKEVFASVTIGELARETKRLEG
jgi:Rrf2 family protein